MTVAQTAAAGGSAAAANATHCRRYGGTKGLSRVSVSVQFHHRVVMVVTVGGNRRFLYLLFL